MAAERGHLDLISAIAEVPPSLPKPVSAPDTRIVSSGGAELARKLAWAPGQRESYALRDRCNSLSQAFQPLLALLDSPPDKNVSDDVRLLHENAFLVRAELEAVCTAFKPALRIPHVQTRNGTVVPRIAALADAFLCAAEYQFSETSFSDYVSSFQEITVLKMAELWALIPALKLVLLEQIAGAGGRLLRQPNGSEDIDRLIGSLRVIKQTKWREVIEPLLLFDCILGDDPAGAYSRMDYETREMYRTKLVNIAEHSDVSEIDVAREVLALARQAQKDVNRDPRVTTRLSHVGAYLLAEGTKRLEKKLDSHPPIGERMRSFVREHPDEFYLPGITVLTLAIAAWVVLAVTNPWSSFALILLSLLVLLVPSSQSAVQIVNGLVTRLLPAKILPKLDFSEGLPNDCVTLVAIPTLLLNEDQVRKLVHDLEVRYLGNQDANLHFALLSDLPDAVVEPKEDTALVDLASNLIRGLNEKYADKRMGSFLLLHRKRVYNARERLWMGWERKRGKLMDLNALLRGQFDSFPIKVGALSMLSSVRFVITLDSDTELPRGSARRMVGALAHPLNQAILDPEKGLVIAGYGILQPRVGVSVQSTARSRLATVYSGQTGFDIYTHATSDVYQDLYGEGIFVGKGIYEVETLHRILDGRFPRNALLSHDLVEGAYARAGLLSDVEVIEDYPSHYSAHNRRKHRWLRGDWQTTGWLSSQVRDEAGRQVPNPLSAISQWKVFDNLRRSLVEPAMFVLFLLGWIWLPGRAEAWTLATIAILFLPALCELLFDMARAVAMGKLAVVQDALNGFLNTAIANGLTVTFLAHQALLSMDALLRTMVRRVITRRRLLQWETAAEAELNGCKRNVLDIYLNWTPAMAMGAFALVWFAHRAALPVALPILLLWAGSKPISLWLNRPPRAPRKQTSERERWLLRVAALRTWRYFAEFSTEEHNWLVPDNVREEGAKAAPRISPTNLGFLLNARQVACEFGYLTVPEFTQHTVRTLTTMSNMQRYRGHFLNWYDTRSLAALHPAIVSSVDSGNLAASLWTLRQGCLELLNRPLFQPELPDGLLDHLYLLTSLRTLPRRKFSAIRRKLKRQSWLQYLLDNPGHDLQDITASSSSQRKSDARWFHEQVEERIRQVSLSVQLYLPWLLPKFSALTCDRVVRLPGSHELPVLEQMPDLIDSLALRLRAALDISDSEETRLCRELLLQLPQARAGLIRLIEQLKKIADLAAGFVDEMDFGFLLHKTRGLLSIGFDVEKECLYDACYDLLASEARIAFFVAIAKDDIPQESWFQLSRTPTLVNGTAGLLSWTGTMFEYLMPALWMRIYPNTLLERSAIAAVRAQGAYAADKHIPWGISESACCGIDDCGNYQYHAFGVPQLAIHKVDADGPVVSPYSTFLALDIDPSAALQNLRKLKSKRSLGTYGFYEALDFNLSRCRSRWHRFELVRCWMAHHQGMSLLSIANFMRGKVMQRWFHDHPRVQATQLLLQEKPARHLGLQRPYANSIVNAARVSPACPQSR